MIQCVMTALDRNPLDFAACLPHFLKLYCDTALVSMDAATVHSIRAKRRVLLTRFLARALLSPFYRQEWLHSPVPGRCPLTRASLLHGTPIDTHGGHARPPPASMPSSQGDESPQHCVVFQKKCVVRDLLTLSFAPGMIAQHCLLCRPHYADLPCSRLPAICVLCFQAVD